MLHGKYLWFIVYSYIIFIPSGFNLLNSKGLKDVIAPFFLHRIASEIFIKRGGASATNSVIDPTFLAGDLNLIFDPEIFIKRGGAFRDKFGH